MKALPSQEYLRSRIEYNPETGEARWKEVDSSHGPRWKHFNANYAGQTLSKRISIHRSQYSVARLIYKLHYGKDIAKVRFLDGNSSNLCASNLKDECASLEEKLESLKYCTSTPKRYNPLPEELKDLLRYNHKTGELVWKSRDRPNWDAKHAGREAGYKSSGYRKVKISHLGTFFVHRIAWFLYYNEDPREYQIDHKDGVRDNNKILNLRLASASLNSQAKHFKREFSQREDSGRWSSTISIHNNTIRLGDFNTQEEARQAYEDAITRYKSEYTPTPGEQRVLDELYNTYPRAATKLQQAAHEIQIRAVQWYDTAYRRTGKFSVDQPLKLLDKKVKQQILEHYHSGKVVEFYSPATEHWQALAPDSLHAFEHEDLIFRARLPESFY